MFVRFCSSGCDSSLVIMFCMSFEDGGSGGSGFLWVCRGRDVCGREIHRVYFKKRMTNKVGVATETGGAKASYTVSIYL